MKFRIGFITNSSSNSYIIRNLTNTKKTMLDVLIECTKGCDPWEFIDWRPETYDENEDDDPPTGNEYLEGVTFDGKEIPAQEKQLFLETVASLVEFPPHTDILCWFSTSNSSYGKIYINGTLSSSDNFQVKHLEQ